MVAGSIDSAEGTLMALLKHNAYLYVHTDWMSCYCKWTKMMLTSMGLRLFSQ